MRRLSGPVSVFDTKDKLLLVRMHKFLKADKEETGSSITADWMSSNEEQKVCVVSCDFFFYLLKNSQKKLNNSVLVEKKYRFWLFSPSVWWKKSFFRFCDLSINLQNFLSERKSSFPILSCVGLRTANRRDDQPDLSFEEGLRRKLIFAAHHENAQYWVGRRLREGRLRGTHRNAKESTSTYGAVPGNKLEWIFWNGGTSESEFLYWRKFFVKRNIWFFVCVRKMCGTSTCCCKIQIFLFL